MSNFLAVATVTAAFSQLLTDHAISAVSGAKVSTLRPDGRDSIPQPGVNIFLYQVTTNTAWNNADLPTRRATGQLLQRPRTALNLHYLLTFYGDDASLEPQRLLGSVARVLHAHPVLSRELIRATLLNDTYKNILGTSDLADDIDLVRFTPLTLTLEELSKAWSVFLQAPYRLSMAYQGAMVLIENDEETVHPTLPVRQPPLVRVTLLRQPVIDQVVSQAPPGQPIVAGGTILIQGRDMQGDTTLVGIDGVEIAPAPADVSNTQISLALPATLHSGAHGVQVVNKIPLGQPLTPHSGVSSNQAAFVLHPAITKTGANFNIAISPPVAAPDGTRSADVTVKLNPKVGLGQRTILLMNEFNPASVARTYSFSNPPLTLGVGVLETDTIQFHIQGVAAADYLVRVQVDGAESLLEVDASQKYVQPRMTVA